MKNNEFMLVRHSYDDHSYIDGKNDSPLNERGIQIAKEASEEILRSITDDRELVMRYSLKRRAKETAEIICDKLCKYNIPFILVKDAYLTELNQGKFNFYGMEHSQKVDFLQSCWDDFESERANGVLSHRFGEWKDRNIVLTPGENHLDFSVRMGLAVRNILEDMIENKQVIGITHRGATFEIQNIVKMMNGTLPIDKVELYKTIGMKYCEQHLLEIKDYLKAKRRIDEFIERRNNLRNIIREGNTQ